MSIPPVGARIREERLKRGVTLRALARAVGVSASMVSQIETGKSQPSVSTLYAITQALGISIEDVFDAAPRPAADGHGSPPPQSPGASADAGSSPPDEAAPLCLSPGTAPSEAAAAGRASPSGEASAAPSEASASDSEHGVVVAHPAVDEDAAAGLAPEGPAAALAAPRAAAAAFAGPLLRTGEREVLELESGVTWERLGHVPGTDVDFLLVTYAPGGSSSSTGKLMRHGGVEHGYLIEGELTLTLGFDTYRMRPGDSVSFPSATPHRYHNEGDVPAVGVWFVHDTDTSWPPVR